MTRVLQAGRYNLGRVRSPHASLRDRLKHASTRQLLEMLDQYSDDKPAADGLEQSTCPDCGGTGQYTGLQVVESCSRCGGTGTLA